MTGLIVWILVAVPLAAFAFDKNPALIDVQDGKSRPAPAELALGTYLEWSAPILQSNGEDYTSAFTAKVFEWFAEEKDRGLPSEVYRDPQKIFVNVGRPLQQTIELESAGEIEEGNTIGAEVYAEMTGTPFQVLETMLYRWGRPPGQGVGQTYPPGGNFARRIDYFAPNPDWGAQAYASLTLRRDGGILHNLFDRYLLLVRGDEQSGYDVLMQYTKPGGVTETKQVFAIAIVRPLGNGKVSYKISTRFQGQSYKILGNVSIGRAKIGFSIANVRAVQLESGNMLKELQDTGGIKDRKTDIAFEK